MRIQQIQEIHALDELDSVDKKIEALAIAYDLTIDEVESKPMDDIIKKLASVKIVGDGSKPKFKFKHNKKRYELIVNPLELKAHQWIELQEIYQGDIIENLHRIMALLSVEKSWWHKKRDISKQEFDKRSEEFLSLDFDIAYNYAIFFLEVYPELLKTTLSYLKAEMEKLKEQISDQV